jgi:phosphoglycerate dehydrogenase-like enzyme
MTSDRYSKEFRIGFSADFRDDTGAMIFPDIGLSLLDNVAGLSYGFVQDYRDEYTPDQLQDCDVLISFKPRIAAGSLEGIERLCAIGRCGVGYDNIDLPTCTENDIAVFITPGGVVRPVAESIVLFVLALSHNLVLKDRLLRQGRWKESASPLGREPRKRIVGTIGLGNIASAAIQLLKSFDVARFLAFDPYAPEETANQLGVELVGLDEVLRQSDYLLINCPLTPQTRGLMGKREFSLMKANSVLINTARGPIVNEQALVEALENKIIRAAALDVFEQEPLSVDSPLIAMDNVILTSHSIAWTEELFRDMGRIDCEGALSIYRGEPPKNVVNREVLNRPGFLKKLENYRSLSGGSDQ